MRHSYPSRGDPFMCPLADPLPYPLGYPLRYHQNALGYPTGPDLITVWRVTTRCLMTGGRAHQRCLR